MLLKHKKFIWKVLFDGAFEVISFCDLRFLCRLKKQMGRFDRLSVTCDSSNIQFYFI